MGDFSTDVPSSTQRTIWPIIEAVLYGISFIAGFCVAVPVNESKFFGQCFLYYSTEFPNYGPTSNCDYIIVISILFCIIYSGAQAALQLFIFIKAGNGEGVAVINNSFGIICTLSACANVVITFLLVIAAGILSAGFQALCASLTETSYFSCSEIGDIYAQQGMNFYSDLQLAQGAIWVSFVAYLALSIISVYNVKRGGLIPGGFKISSAQDQESPVTNTNTTADISTVY